MLSLFLISGCKDNTFFSHFMPILGKKCIFFAKNSQYICKIEKKVVNLQSHCATNISKKHYNGTEKV